MNRILADLNAYGKMWWRTKVGPFFTFAFPVLLIVLFGAIFSSSNTMVNIHVQDLDESPTSAAFIAALNGTNLTTIHQIPKGADMAAYIKDNSLSAAIQIPAGFGASVGAHAPSAVVVYGDPSRSSYGMVLGIVSGVADGMNFQLNNATPVVYLEPRSVASPEFRFMDFFLPGILGMTVMFTAMYGMTGSVAEYKTRRYFKLIASTPISKMEWLLSKIAFYVLLTLASLAVMLLIGIAMWNVAVALTPIALLILVAATFLFVSLGVIIGAYSKDPESGAAIANAIGFPMMFLSGSFFNLEQMPPTMQAIASVFPLTYVNNGLRDSMIFGNDSSALVGLAIVSVMAAVATLAAARLIKWTRD